MTKPVLRQSRLGAARKNLSVAEQNLKKISNTKVRTSAGQSTIGKSRAYELSREDNKRYNDAQKSVSLARKNLKTEQQRAANYAKQTLSARPKANNKDISKSLGSVANNRGMKNADVKGTVKLAEKTLSTAKQKLRTHDASMGGTKQRHDALKKQVKTAEKNLKSLNKTASKRK